MLNSPPFVVAVFAGNSKPESAATYLTDLVQELSMMLNNGFEYDNKHYTIFLQAFICDAPARAFIKCIKGHTGYFGCEKCVQKGKSVERRLVFPEMHADKRTDNSFKDQAQPEHHKGYSPLLNLGVGLVSRIPLNYMHLICLGVVKRLLLIWLRGDRQLRISMQHSELISDQLSRLKPFVCSEFQKKLVDYRK